eukprot:1296075-Pyramimonas_sp.AAC.1
MLARTVSADAARRRGICGRPLVPYSVEIITQVSLESLRGLGKSLARGVQDVYSLQRCVVDVESCVRVE